MRLPDLRVSNSALVNCIAQLLVAILIGRQAIRQAGDDLSRQTRPWTLRRSWPRIIYLNTITSNSPSLAAGAIRMVGAHRSASPCPGPLHRREFLRVGLAGLGGLALPELLH